MKVASKVQNSEVPKKSCLSEIQRLQKDRDERRKNMEKIKSDRAAEEQLNRENGTPGDVDFQRMIRVYREQAVPERPHQKSNDKICICVRKRPISAKEVKKLDHDSVTCLNPIVAVHACKLKVDGISKYLDNNLFEMDHTFHEDDTTEDIYTSAVEPLVDFVLDGGRATVFAYGQTGSGKTYTMQGIQSLIGDDLFALIESRGINYQVTVSFFEIYGGRCQDLLNDRQRLNVREDGSGEVVVSDLLEIEVDSASALRDVIDDGFRNRTTHATESNDESSRSHAICQVSLRSNGREVARLSLIDLAGSERGADTKSHNRQRRMEGAEINKSLLALKECIRALDGNSSHVPYRASKLTLVLKDSFTRQKSRTVMIATVSPAASSADHTINTLRYADRIKERVVSVQQIPPTPSPCPNVIPTPSVNSTKGTANPASARLSASPSPLAGVPSTGSGRNHGPASVPGPAVAANRALAPTSDSRNPSVRREAKDSNIAAAINVKSTTNAQPITIQSESKPARSSPRYESKSSKQISESKSDEDIEKENNRFRNSVDDDNDTDDVENALNELQQQENDDLVYTMEEEFHKTVQSLFEEEEELLNLHMTVIQENAELLTEEGRLLQQMQTDDYDIDNYASKLDGILARKQELIGVLREKLSVFRKQLQAEETISRKVRGGC